jgi:PAS domain S-box-containing protein
MNIFVLLSLFASISCLSLGIIVYSINRKTTLNKIFFLTSLATFIYSLTTVLMWTSSDVESAFLWNKMGSIWPFFVALVVNFALVFTESKWLKNKFNYLILYLPALSLCLIELLSNFINAPPIMESWGFNDVPSGTLIYWLSTIWTALLPILAFVLCFRFYRRAKDSTQRQRRKFVTIGFAIPIAAFIFTNMILRSFNVDIPNLGIVATFFFSIFVAYAIVKYDLFTFDAALAADNILSTMPDSLILADMNAKILNVNERLVNFVGYSEKELIDESITKLCAEKQENIFEITLNELVEKKLIRNHELIFQTKSKETRNVLFSGSVVKSKTGRAIGIACVIHDITEHKKMEERLVKTERLASIGELAGQIGHDLRNPLAGIKNGLYILKKKSDRLTESEKGKILEIMAVAVEDSNRIVTSLVDYSSELILQPEQCTPKSLVMHALSKVQVPDRINVINQINDDVTMFLDAPRIENVCVSLIKNAIEATPEKGSIQIQSAINNDYVELAFIDSGIGIPKDILPKLFSPLVTSKAKGMGMGLAICKRIVEAHRGKIAVESATEKGTTFTVTLPINLSKSDFSTAGSLLNKT